MDYRRKANVVLGIVFFLFVLAIGGTYFYPALFYLRLVRFVLEAALIGGLADWFAVTALFRRPLGWPYHTALIPRNRAKMITAVTEMVEHQLLSVSVLQSKIAQISVSKALINYVDKQGIELVSAKLASRLGSYWHENYTQLLALIEVKLKDKLKQTDLLDFFTSAAKKGVEGAAFNQALDTVLERIVEVVSTDNFRTQLIFYLENFKQAQTLSAGMWQKTLLGIFQAADGINMEEAADSLQTQALLTLRMLREPEHELRLALKKNLHRSVDRAAIDPEFNLDFTALAKEMIERLPIQSLLTDLCPQDPAVFSGLNEVFIKYWPEFKIKVNLHNELDNFFYEFLQRILQSEHVLIGSIVKKSLESLSDNDLNHFVQAKAGNDLQWIRINGSFVGGIIGLILFLFLNFLYLPLIQRIF